MQDTQPKLSPIAKRILIILGTLLVVALVTVGTAFFLKSVVPKKEAASTNTPFKASEIVAMYAVPGVVKGLSDSLYDQQLDDGMNVPLIYKLDGRQYTVTAQTRHNVLFYSRTTSPQDDVKAIQDQTTVFMNSKGYKKTEAEGQIVDKNNQQLSVTYASDRTVCRLTSSGTQTFKGSPASHQLACADRSVIDDEYAAVEKLLELYGASNERPSFTEAVRSVAIEDNKSYATLQLITAEQPPTLLFAAIDKDWSYIGNLNGSKGESTGKYVLSPDIKTKISDSKYGDFLTKNILGRSSS